MGVRSEFINKDFKYSFLIYRIFLYSLTYLQINPSGNCLNRTLVLFDVAEGYDT